MPSFVRPKDSIESPKLKRSRDGDRTPFRGGLSSVGWDLLWSTYVPNLKVTISTPVMETGKTMQSVENGMVYGSKGHSLIVIGNSTIR